MKRTLSFTLILLTTVLHAQIGDFDPYFGDNGIVLVPFLGAGEADFAECVVIQPDQHFIVVGSTSNGTNTDLVLLRYASDGTPDASFGTNGRVFHDLAAGDEHPASAVLDALGRIVVGGTLFTDTGNSTTDYFTARFLPDGSLDASFNGTGLLVRSIHPTGTSDRGREVLVRADGKVVLVGETGPSDAYTELFVERYFEDGTLDPDLAGDGSALVYLDGLIGAKVMGAAFDADENLLLAGSAKASGSNTPIILLTKVDDEGNVTNAFGEQSGYTLLPSPVGGPMPCHARAIAVASDGSIVIGGEIEVTGATQFIQGFDADGLPNDIHSTFDSNGDNSIAALAIDAQDRILFAGKHSVSTGTYDWLVGRMLSDGSTDFGFATGGSKLYDADGDEEECQHLAIFSNGNILGVGRMRVDGKDHIGLVKYEGGLTVGVGEAVEAVRTQSLAPNPSNGSSTLRFQLSTASPVTVCLVDAQGRNVKQFTLGVRNAGEHSLTLDLNDVAKGSYQVVVTAEGRHRVSSFIKQ